MAEFLNWRDAKNRHAIGPVPDNEDGFNQMGKPIPMFRRMAADENCKDMGLADSGQRLAVIQGMAEYLERDEPYKAMEVGMRYLDLTGTYRLMAVLLVAPNPNAALKRHRRSRKAGS